MQSLNQAYEWLSAHFLGGVPADNVALIVGVLLSYVLAHAFQRIPCSMPAAKHLFSVVASAISYGIVQDHVDGVVHLAAGSVVAYILMRTLRGRAMPRAVFAMAMLHLSYSHIWRQVSEIQNGRVQQDYTGAQMVFVMKITSLANCIYDGQRRDQAALTSYQRRNAVAAVPGLLEYLGYVFFFPSFAIGPSFELATYRRMVQLDCRRVSGQMTRCAYARLLEGLGWMAVYVRYSHVSFAAMIASPVINARRSFVSTVVGVCAAGFVARTGFYTAWRMSEGACVLAGLGFDGLDDRGEAKWADIANIDVRKVELGTSLREMIDGWNIGTNTWLRHHVYLRVTPPRPADSGRTSSTRATLLTFLVSAWWHGFYPGYYLTFVMGALASSAARILRRNLRPLVVARAAGHITKHPVAIKAAYDFVGWALSIYTLNFLGAPFLLLWIQPSLLLWRLNHFVVPAAALLTFILFRVIGAGSRPLRAHAVAGEETTKQAPAPC